ncbi:MAG: class I SAM-dependent methyltransferase [Firmicutes bacterium]|nr:class I SAM-dependent methyltransferase [Bacillota bacterium]
MSEHYFTVEPNSDFKPGSFTTRLRGREFTFLTGAGVFSRERVDPGTRLLLDSLVLSGVRAPLDLGCGYGVIGLVIAAELPEVRVFMSDPNKRAVALAATNAARNGLTNVCIKEGEGFVPWPSQTFDLIACNPPLRAGKATVLGLFYDAAERLRPGGSLWTVIRTAQGAKSYFRELEKVFATVELVALKSGYRVLRAAVTPGS